MPFELDPGQVSTKQLSKNLGTRSFLSEKFTFLFRITKS